MKFSVYERPSEMEIITVGGVVPFRCLFNHTQPSLNGPKLWRTVINPPFLPER